MTAEFVTRLLEPLVPAAVSDDVVWDCVTCGACVLALSFPLALAAGQSWVFATSWPNSTAFIAILGPLVAHTSGHLLVEDPSIAEYYLPAGSQWERWSGTRNIVLASGVPTGGPSDAAGVVGDGNAGTYALYIQASYFSLVALNFSDTVPGMVTIAISPSQVLQNQPFFESFCTKPARSPLE